MFQFSDCSILKNRNTNIISTASTLNEDKGKGTLK